MCCLLALVALYKLHQLNAVYQRNYGGLDVKDGRLLHWKTAHVVFIEDIVKLQHPVLNESAKQHRKIVHQLYSFAKP